MAAYGQSSYWEDRYMRDPEPFDWYQRYEQLRPLLTAAIDRRGAVLNVGCGNSRLTEDMSADGFERIANVDISRTVIDAMAARHKDRRGVTWQVMNATQLAFGDAAFDAVVDKGTLDSLLCGDNSTANCAKYFGEVSRVLRPGGVFFCVSYGNPENRLQYMENDEYRWRVTVKTLPKPTVSAKGELDAADPTQNHFIYILQRT
jgi:SAM-dependent methyltransferase